MGKDFFLKNVKIKLFPGGKMPVYKTAVLRVPIVSAILRRMK